MKPRTPWGAIIIVIALPILFLLVLMSKAEAAEAEAILWRCTLGTSSQTGEVVWFGHYMLNGKYWMFKYPYDKGCPKSVWVTI